MWKTTVFLRFDDVLRSVGDRIASWNSRVEPPLLQARDL